MSKDNRGTPTACGELKPGFQAWVKEFRGWRPYYPYVPAAIRPANLRWTRARLVMDATVLVWAAVLVLWAANVWRAGGSVVFLIAASSVAVYALFLVVDLSQEGGLVRGAVGAVLIFLFVAVPAAFDPTSFDVFNITKYTLVVTGALVLVGLWVIYCLVERSRPLLRNGLHWPVLALAVWTVATTVTSINVRISMLGFYKSYDGLFTALAVTAIFFVIVQFISASDVRRALSVLYLGGGGLTALYGFMQLHDRMIGGPTWDWIPWGDATFKEASIWGSFGNPNHLAGFVVALVPIGIALFFTTKDIRLRALIFGTGLALMLVLLHTSTRGAWLAAVVILILLVVVHMPEIKAHPRLSLTAAGIGATLIIGAVVALGAAGLLSRSLSGIFQFGGTSSVVLRAELWTSALDMGTDRPLVGSGPDTYRILFPAYQSSRFVDLYGPDQVANGPHNVFLNYLVTQGFPGLVAFVTVVVYAVLRGVGAWRRLRAREKETKQDNEDGPKARRFLLNGVLAGCLAVLIQGSFNVQQVGLTFTFWTLLGILCVITLGAGVPISLDPRKLVGVQVQPEPDRNGYKNAWDTKGRDRGPARGRAHNAGIALAGIATAAVIAPGAWAATAPYRADRAFFDAQGQSGRAQIAEFSKGLRREHLRLSLEETKEAIAIHPWEVLYMESWAGSKFETAVASLEAGDDDATRTRALKALGEARDMYERAASLQPQNTFLLHDYARLLLKIEEVDPEDTAAGDQGVAILRKAYDANPWAPDVAVELILASYNHGDVALAIETLDRALELIPDEVTLLEIGVQVFARTGDVERAQALQTRLTAIQETEADQ